MATSFKTIKTTAVPFENVLDINAGDLCGYLIDKSSYLWSWGFGNNQPNGGEAVPNFSTPVQAIADQKFVRLLSGCLALDVSSYAWAWGNNSSLVTGTNLTTGYIRQPIAVAGGIKWIDIKGQWLSRSGLNTSSYAWCWGQNTNGECGNNTAGDIKSSPVSVVGGKQFIAIDQGTTSLYAWTVALDASSYAWAWGYNGAALPLLGDNTNASQSSPVSVVGGKQWRSIYCTRSRTAGQGCTIGLDSSSYAWAWGTNDNSYYAMGIGPASVSYSSPVSVHGPWDNIYRLGICFVANRGDAYYVWGINNVGQLGDRTNLTKSSPTPVAYPNKFINIAGTVEASRQVSAFALDANSTVWVWGSNASGQLCANNTIDYNTPTRPFIKTKTYSTTTGTSINSHPDITTKIYAGSPGSGAGLFIYLDNSSYAWAWGSNSTGVCGTNSGDARHSVPTSVVGNKQFTKLFLGSISAYALDVSSYAWAWGSNADGVLGENTVLARSSPVSVVGSIRWRKISSSTSSFVGIDTSSYVWACGYNGTGGLGDGSIASRSSPVSVIGGRQARDIATNGAMAIMLDASSYAWSWGQGSNGRLGDNTIVNKSSPVSVVGGKQWLAVGANSLSIYALDASSYLWAWGGNTLGSCGDNTILNRSSPVSVVGGRQFRGLLIDAGATATNTLALDLSSYAWSWGYNSAGECGDGTIANRSSPVSVLGGYQFNKISGFFSGTYTASYGVTASSVLAWGGTGTYAAIWNLFLGGSSGANSSSPLAINPKPHTYVVSPDLVKRQNILGD